MYELKEFVLIKLASLFKINLLGAAFKGLGIGLSQSMDKNGEELFLQRYLSSILNSDQNVFFDVGMNRGEYTALLQKYFPRAQIHGVEANSMLMSELHEKFGNFKNIHIHNFAVSDSIKNEKLYVYTNEKTTGHGSLNKDVFKILRGTNDVSEIDVKVSTLSNICQENSVDEISFLKLDIEGYEYQALVGLGNKIENVKAIQLEFNDANVLSRVFMRDFFELLKNFNAYRLLPRGLLPLRRYNSNLEIFRIQNLIFINKRFDSVKTL